ncbi:hypothetical protein H4R99_001927 [Coemansia sp. RSA 1722]|nr:hypothetical protein IWW45_001693 [Coemansia sp. RSA 485]KAJ2604261.1 hypothetical protein H4R99_001927 [Coemansia sp. RSA 1722]
MTASLIKLQNTEVVVGLVGSHSIARPGDTSKYFTRTTSTEPERVYVDGCTADTANLFSVGNLRNYVKHAVEGGTSALFLSGAGVTRLGDYDRKKLMTDFCNSIGKCMAQFDPDLSMTYAFLGVTDGKVVDFHRDRNVSMDKLSHGLGDLQHVVEDWEHTEQKILRGATLPFILSLHFESIKGTPTNGHLCLIDMNLVSWVPMGIASDSTNGLATTRKLQQSAKSLSTLIHLLANDAILNGATVPGSALVSLTGEFLYGESKTAFIMYLGTDEGASEDLEASIDLIRSLRKLRSREIIRPVDRRVMFFFEKAKYYQSEKYRLQDELTDLQDEKEQLEKDLDDIQRDFGEERDALSKEVGHWQSKSKTLEETLEALRSQSAGIEADIRWENAKLVTEALALKDELRKAEIDMTSAEDSQSKLLDLYEGLQGSYNSLDSVYSELLSAYRMLKERYGKMAESNATLQETIQELEGQAKLNEQSIKDIKGEIKKTAADSRKQVEQLENKHAEEVNELEAQISAFTQNAAELNAKVAHLETQNKSLSVSQSKEASQLQNTIQELSSQLEDVQRQAAAESSTLASSLRSAEKLINRLETERVRLADKVDELSVSSEMHEELGAKESMWLREREQLMRQIDRYQKAIESAERRESELRDESETQWAAWESEKNRNHQKYLKLKDRFREAVDFAADAQIQLEGAREKTTEPELGTNHSTLSNGHACKQTRRKAAPKKTAPAPLSIDQTSAQAIGVEDDEHTGMDVDTPTASVHSLATKDAETASEPAHERRSTTRNRRVQPNYAESDDNEDSNFGMVDPVPSSRGRQNNGSKSKPRNKNTRSELAAKEGASDNSGDSDDSEITFNTSSTTTQQKQQPKTRGRAPRAKKSAEELNAELRTQPARKRATASGKNKASNGLSASTNAGAGDSIDETVDGQSENAAAAAAAAPLPKRKRAVQPRASKASATKALSAGIQDSADDAAAAVSALPTAVSVAGSNGAGSNALKKKRKLNLSRMRNLLGFSADVSALSEANSHQAVKFVVPKIRTMGAAGSSAALAAADPADSD